MQRSIRYRTEQYGYYSGFGLRAGNPRPLANQMRVATVADLHVVLHERVIPALHCVEQAIERDCPGVPYRPQSLGGTRQNNTYLGGDVSNQSMASRSTSMRMTTVLQLRRAPVQQSRVPWQ
ncbi:MAG: hypothetical protein WDO69_27505 [Pseudomonadota bacterium]